MSWLTLAAERLAALPRWSYAPGSNAATEPTALAALALMDQHPRESQRAIDTLVRWQAVDGSLGVTIDQKTPCWPTSLAVLAWCGAQRKWKTHLYTQCIARSMDWLLQHAGTTPPRAAHVGHDTTIPGWPWVLGTHSWVEPTAFVRLALVAANHADHPRAAEAQRLLVDRLLTTGGCNYGNSGVLGQELLPQIQPTGIALLAIDPEDTDPRIERSLDYLTQSLSPRTTLASLCWGLIGLAAHGRTLKTSAALLARSFSKPLRGEHSGHQLALLLLATQGSDCVLIPKNSWSSTVSTNT